MKHIRLLILTLGHQYAINVNVRDSLQTTSESIDSNAELETNSNSNSAATVFNSNSVSVCTSAPMDPSSPNQAATHSFKYVILS